jgi:hypothetical protein
MSFQFCEIGQLELGSFVTTPLSAPLTATTKSSGGTMTAAQLAGGIIVNTQATTSSLTTDTGANLFTRFHPTSVGQSFTCFVCNTTLAAITISGGTNVTVVGPTESASFYLTFVYTGSSTNWTCYC